MGSLRICYGAVPFESFEKATPYIAMAVTAPLGLEIVERQLEAARRTSLVSEFPTFLVAISGVPAGKEQPGY